MTIPADAIVIRTATPADIETLYAFEQGVIAAERPMDPTLKSGQINYYDMQELLHAPHIELAVAEIDHTIVGSGYARIEAAKPYLQHRQYAYLGFMYTLPAYRGRGVNGRVLQYLSDWAGTKGVTELRLDVYADNATAIKAYEKAGFTQHLICMRHSLDDERLQ